jgi:hypothetical protein
VEIFSVRMAEWSKAVVLGTILHWRGFKSHSAHFFTRSLVIHNTFLIKGSAPISALVLTVTFPW